MELSNELYEFIDRSHLYCNTGCKYEDSVGFCKILFHKNRHIVPKDAPCHGIYRAFEMLPRDIIPDDCRRKVLKEEYGIR